MAEYIDREFALDVVKRTSGDYAAAFSEIAHAKAADVAPVEHGKWIFDGDWWDFVCTECNGRIGNIKKYKYCPHCGAKMDCGG